MFQASRLLINVVAAATLGPSTFGAWVLITLVLQYASFLSLGIPNGMGREVPLRLGAGQRADAELAEDVALSTTLLSSLVGAAAAAILIWTVGEHGTAGDPAIVALVAAAMFSQQIFLFAQILLRSRFAFRAAGIQLTVVGGVTVAGGLVLVRFGLPGLIASQVLAQSTCLAVALVLLKRTPHLRWDPATARRLIAVGLPLMLAGVAYLALTTLDRWLVLTFLGTAAVGIYGLVGLAVSSLLVVVTILSQQAYPHLAFAIGAGQQGPEILALAHRQSRLAVVLGGMFVVGISLVAWLGIPIFLPAYEAAVGPMLISMLGSVAYAWASGFANIMTTAGAQREYLAIQVASIAADVAIAIVLLRLGLGLIGVSTAFAVTMLAYSLGLRWRARVAVRRLGQRPPATGDTPLNEAGTPVSSL